MFVCQIKINSIQNTMNLAKKLAQVISFNDILCLAGEIGTGKTFLTKSLLNILFANDKDMDISSPTFNIVNIYEYNYVSVWHVDLYRLNSEHEFLQLGVDEVFGESLTIIEWADKLNTLYPLNAITIKLEIHQQQRQAIISAKHPSLISKLSKVFENEYL